MFIHDRDRPLMISLMNSPQWKVMNSLADKIIFALQTDPRTADTEWETARNSVDAEGQMKGIRRFLQEIQNASHGNA